MKRYDVEVVRHDGQLECDIEPIACKNGPFVMYDDVEAELSSLRAANAELMEALSSPGLLETLAALEHERWSGWMKYQAEKAGGKHPITGEPYEIRWKRQSETPYARLPEQERESDRVEARKTLAAIRAALSNSKRIEVKK